MTTIDLASISNARGAPKSPLDEVENLHLDLYPSLSRMVINQRVSEPDTSFFTDPHLLGQATPASPTATAAAGGAALGTEGHEVPACLSHPRDDTQQASDTPSGNYRQHGCDDPLLRRLGDGSLTHPSVEALYDMYPQMYRLAWNHGEEGGSC